MRSKGRERREKGKEMGRKENCKKNNRNNMGKI
jgi:hypothetical protein